MAAILGMKREDLVELTYQSAELLPNILSEKRNYLDIRIKLRTGEEIDIEIQRFYSADILDRFLYYWAKMFTKQLREGQKYRELNKCICINILDFKLSEFEDCHLIYHIMMINTNQYSVTCLRFIYWSYLKRRNCKI